MSGGWPLNLEVRRRGWGNPTFLSSQVREVLSMAVELSVKLNFFALGLWSGSNNVTHYDKPREHIKKQRRYFANKGPSSQSYGFSSSHVWMWDLDCKESWALNWYFHIVVLEKTLESPLDSKEIQPVHPKGNQSWIFIGRTDAETAILWPPGMKNWLIWKDPDAGQDWRREEKGTVEDEMVGWITDSMDMNLSEL